MTLTSLPRPVVLFGLAGILPQAACVAIALTRPDDRWFALAAGCCYAAVILSFLGGLWWMAALLRGVRQPWVYLLAVAPSLVGWASLLPWCFGWPWPALSLLVLGLTVLASPLADHELGRFVDLPTGWLPLRLAMAGGLGLLTIALAFA